jgi:hypothetical protein
MDEFDAQAVDAIEVRLIALEEITAARWPRRMILRRRLARSLRASDAAYADAAGTFTGRRVQAAGDDLIIRAQRR